MCVRASHSFSSSDLVISSKILEVFQNVVVVRGGRGGGVVSAISTIVSVTISLCGPVGGFLETHAVRGGGGGIGHRIVVIIIGTTVTVSTRAYRGRGGRRVRILWSVNSVSRVWSKRREERAQQTKSN